MPAADSILVHRRLNVFPLKMHYAKFVFCLWSKHSKGPVKPLLAFGEKRKRGIAESGGSTKDASSFKVAQKEPKQLAFLVFGDFRSENSHSWIFLCRVVIKAIIFWSRPLESFGLPTHPGNKRKRLLSPTVRRKRQWRLRTCDWTPFGKVLPTIATVKSLHGVFSFLDVRQQEKSICSLSPPLRKCVGETGKEYKFAQGP